MLKINEFKSLITNTDLERPNLFGVTISPPKAIQESFVYDINLKTNWNRLNAGKDLTLLCQSINTPSMGFLMSEEVQRQGIGPLVKYPVKPVFSDSVTATFLSDGSSKAYDFFYSWLNFITPVDGNYKIDGILNRSYFLEYKDTYKSPYITIDVYRAVKGKITNSLTKNLITLGSNALARYTRGASFIIGERIKAGLSALEEPPELFSYKQFRLINAYPIAISEMNYNHSSSDTFNTFNVTFEFSYMEHSSVDSIPSAQIDDEKSPKENTKTSKFLRGALSPIPGLNRLF